MAKKKHVNLKLDISLVVSEEVFNRMQDDDELINFVTANAFRNNSRMIRDAKLVASETEPKGWDWENDLLV